MSEVDCGGRVGEKKILQMPQEEGELQVRAECRLFESVRSSQAACQFSPGSISREIVARVGGAGVEAVADMRRRRWRMMAAR